MGSLPASKGGTSVRTWSTNENRERLSRMGVDPILTHARILLDQMPCLACHGEGRERFSLPDKQKGKPCPSCRPGLEDSRCWRCDGTGLANMTDRTCQSCHGNRREKLTVAAVQHSADELMAITCQKLKQVDHISSDGSQVQGIQIVLVDSPAQVQAATGVRIPPQLMESHE